ncbi:MAG: hypothetical protein ACLFPE_15750, partial [Bacteroidales bacterium]
RVNVLKETRTEILRAAVLFPKDYGIGGIRRHMSLEAGEFIKRDGITPIYCHSCNYIIELNAPLQ